MNSIMDGTYPGPGITLGPGITFGYHAKRHCRPLDRQTAQPAPLENTMYYELRTYTIKPTKLGDWLALYKSAALAVQQEHLGNLIGFSPPKSGEVNQVVHLGLRQPRRPHSPSQRHGGRSALAGLRPAEQGTRRRRDPGITTAAPDRLLPLQ
jgi:hypothetical protein